MKNYIPVHPITESNIGVNISAIKGDLVSDKIIDTPHRHDHYSVFLLEKGKVESLIDFQPVCLIEHTLLVSYPGQVHSLKKIEDCEGWLLSFNTHLIDENVRIIFEESLDNIALVQLKNEDENTLTELLKLIQKSIEQKENKIFRSPFTHSLLNAFVYEVAAIYQKEEKVKIQQFSSRKVELSKTFKKLIQSNFKTRKSTSEYAVLMNITPTYLNDAIKAVTGFSTTYLIQEEVMKEAKRLLCYSEKSIQEIAYELGYEDTKYFHRLFKKTSGSTPKKFREEFNA